MGFHPLPSLGEGAGGRGRLKARKSPPMAIGGLCGNERGYLASSAFFFPYPLFWYFFWNFSTRPVVSTNFILPVKNG